MRMIKIVFIPILFLLSNLSFAGDASDCAEKIGRFFKAVSQPADPLSLAPYGRVAVVTSSAYRVLETGLGTSLCQPPNLWQSLKQNAFAVSVLAEQDDAITTPPYDIKIISVSKQDQLSPVALEKAIGQQPILAFGASDGDIPILEYAGLSTPSLVVVVKNKTYPQQRLLEKAKTANWIILEL